MRRLLDKINYLDVGVCFLILIAPFLNFLEFIDYPLLAGESLTILLGLLLLSFLLFAFAPVESYLLRCLLYTIIIAITFDFSSLPFLPAAANSSATLLSVFIVLIFLWLLRKNMTLLLFVMFLSVNMSTLMMPLVKQLPPLEGRVNTIALADSEALPNIVHLYLDEHIGIEGIPQDLPDGKALAQDLKDFFRANDFQTFGGAHSSYLRSMYSISAMFNFNNSPQNLRENLTKVDDVNPISFEIKSNAYFKNLHEQGYNINVYQSNFMRFCDPLYVREKDCLIYQHDALDEKVIAYLSFGKRVKLLWYTFARRQPIVNKLFFSLYYLSSIDGEPPEKPLLLDLFASVGAMSVPSVIDKITQDVTTSNGGNLYFAHLLIPHSPYTWDAQCQLVEPIYTWGGPTVHTEFSTKEAYLISKTKWSDFYRAYFKQVRCNKLKLQQLFTSMKNAGKFENSIIIIHSDHGSRIAENEPVYAESHTVSSRDIQDGFSTLFAIKIPGEPASYDPDVKSLNKIFFQYMGKGVEQADTHEGEVFFEILGGQTDEFDKEHWKRVKIETPLAQDEE